MTENAMVPMVSLYGLYVQEVSKGRLREQLRAAREDSDWSRRILSANRIASRLLVQEMEAACAEANRQACDALRQRDSAEEALHTLSVDLDELREAYRRELESNGKLRAEVATLRAEAETNDRSAFQAGVDWARERLFNLHARLYSESVGLPTEDVRGIVEKARDIPF